MPDKKSKREIDAFGQFLRKLPHGKDVVLVILKGHLLIEEQVRNIIRERVRDFTRLEGARLGFYQLVCVADALLGPEVPRWVWESLRKLNALRNQIAHEMEPEMLNGSIDKFIASVPSHYKGVERQDHLELKLWGLFVNVSSLVAKPSAEVVALVERRK